MEKLGYQGCFHMADDWRLRADHIRRTTSVDANSKRKLLQKLVDSKTTFLYLLQTLCVQVKCFSEIINIGYAVYRVHNLPWFRSLSWYFLVTSNYFFYGESLIDYFGVLINRIEVLPFLIRYHRFISFTMYVMGFVWFVLSLVKKYYMRQFSLFAWTHVALLIVVTQSYLIIQVGTLASEN